MFTFQLGDEVRDMITGFTGIILEQTRRVADLGIEVRYTLRGRSTRNARYSSPASAPPLEIPDIAFPEERLVLIQAARPNAE